ncbi:MAG TPA: isoprenylcysteine carboxylmethyltransferase family protein [bacterium]
MSSKLKKVLTPAAWVAYLIIGFEIVYMISPFALYYYSSYGPSLNFLHHWPASAWLSGFFLPHYAETSSTLLNSLHAIGWVLVLPGLALFVIAAGQIYYSKFAKKGAVTGGIYKVIRHPQYVAFAIMGFGLLLVWPRFTVLIVYVSMLFVYYFLAKKEERECEQKFRDSYRSYQSRTGMFLPAQLSNMIKLPALPASGLKRKATLTFLYLAILAVSLAAAFGLRDFSISKLSTVYSTNSATIATAATDHDKLETILQIALADARVQQRLNASNNGTPGPFLNYVVPNEWYLPDLPLDEGSQKVGGHHQPKEYDRNLYKVLFTRARLKTDEVVTGPDIVGNTVGRIPVLVAHVDLRKGEVVEITTPPAHVRWGDIPTPLF